MLKDIPQLTYGDKRFVVDKFSGWEQVSFRIDRLVDCIKITYFMNIYFSGQILKIERIAYIDIDEKKSWFKNNYTPEYKFYMDAFKNGVYDVFEKSGYKSSESTDIIPDIIRWFAENTNTDYALIGLKEDIKYCLEFIDKYYPKKK